MTLGERLKQLRIEKGLTQEQLGKIVGLQKQAIWKYENGNVTNMKASSIKTLADFFGVSPSYLMGYTDVRQENTTEELSDGERMILELFRAIPDDKKQMAIEMLKAALQAH
jgi:transcriptional regulator with XRE-family HTH domain